MSTRFVLVAALALFVGCKGKPAKHDPPANLQGSGARVVEPVGTSAGAGSDKVLHLPHGDGTLPKLTKSSPIDAASIARVRALEFPGFSKENLGTDQSIVSVLRTDDRPKLKATVQIRPCNGACVPMELPKWQSRTDIDDLRPTEIKAAADSKFEVGATDLNTQPMIFTYQYGLVKAPQGTIYTDTYVLWFNDGKNEIRVVATFVDNIPQTIQQMLATAPEEDLEKVAKAFMDVYTQAWAN